MTYEFKTQRRVEFSDTDMAGIVHFANYFRYIESAEHAFFRSLGLSIHTAGAEGGDGAPGAARKGQAMQGWARVSAACEFFTPLRYPDEFEIQLLVAEKRSRAISYVAEFFKPGRDGPIARARWTVVRVGRAPGQTELRSADIPEDVASRITVAPPDRLPADTRPTKRSQEA